MPSRWIHSAVTLILLAAFARADHPSGASNNLPQWRGPLGTGIAPNADPPIEWSETKNIRWKTELPGCGHSTPIVWKDHVFLTAAVPIGDALPPRPSRAPGSDQVLWSRSRGTPYVPSPLLYGDVLYFLAHYQGILNRVDARTGEDRPGPLRLPGVTEVYASLVGAADRVYVTDRFGATLVVSHSDTPRLLARNQLDDTFNASAAIAGGDLFLRGEKAVYCLSNTSDDTEAK